MELKNFIASSLTEIQEGVQTAINKTIENGINGVINPSWGKVNNRANNSLIQNVSFDIAVTVEDEDKAGVKGGIKVVGVTFGGENTELYKKSSVSRIQFSIPIIPPVTIVEDH
jgi:hypothetical protein